MDGGPVARPSSGDSAFGCSSEARRGSSASSGLGGGRPGGRRSSDDGLEEVTVTRARFRAGAESSTAARFRVLSARMGGACDRAGGLASVDALMYSLQT